MKTPHKYAALIHAWADGKIVQYKINGQWINVDWAPDCHNGIEYRIKPEVIRYRVAYFSDKETCTADTEEDAKRFENTKIFKKWITDWIEVEL
jgi:hypothetical protein